VGDDVSEDFSRDLLLHGNSADALEVIPIIVVIAGHESFVQVAVIVVVIASSCDLDLLPLDGDFLAGQVCRLLTELEIKVGLLLLKAVVESLDDTGKVLGEALLVDLG
jgi:hypothetical protein